MKKIFTILVALVATISIAQAAPKQPVIKVLAIGNSFSEDAVEQHLHEIAAADGVQMIVGNMYIGGCSIDRHVENIREDKPAYRYRKVGLDGKSVQTDAQPLSKAIKDEKWDYVSLQQVSGWSGIYDSYKNLPELVAFVKANAPKAKIIWHRTWAYASDSKHGDFPKYDRDQQKMYNAILDASARALKENGISIVVPSGTAVQIARGTKLQAVGQDLTRDGFHLDKRLGRYLAAATWYETLTGRDVQGNSYKPENVTDEELALAQKCAHAANHGITPDFPVEIRGSVGQLRGNIRKPLLAEGEKCPLVIINHGFTGNRNEARLVAIADSLQMRGIASVRFDFNGHGQSEGDFIDMTIINELEDVGKVLAYVEGLGFVTKVGMVGHSQGGLVTSLAAPAFGVQRIACEVLLAPAANIPEGARKGNLLGTAFDAVNPPAYIKGWGHKVGLSYLKTAQMIPVWEEAAKYKGPVCIIHGSGDKAVPVEFGKKYHEKLPQSEIHIMEGQGHGLDKVLPEVCHITAAFFAAGLK